MDGEGAQMVKMTFRPSALGPLDILSGTIFNR